MKTTFQMENKVAVVTGAASGVGRATAVAYAKLGIHLAILDINEQGLQETKALLNDFNINVKCYSGDISNSEYCTAIINTIATDFSAIDILCNIAGIVGFKALPDITTDYWRKTFAVNVDAPFFLSQAALPHLIKTHGNIVNIGSSAAMIGEAFLVPYAASKAALVHMTKSMAVEYIHSPVRINVIAPGAIDTAIMNGQEFPENIDFELVNRYIGLRKASSPEEIADFIVFISSPQAKSIHGACLSIDGGITAG